MIAFVASEFKNEDKDEYGVGIFGEIFFCFGMYPSISFFT